MTMYAIHTRNLTKYYGKARGIIDLNLTVEQGECFGFIGPNGAGKSTTIRTLLGLIFPTSGTAEVLGKNVGKEKEEILRNVGYLPSEALFYPGMRVRDVLKKAVIMNDGKLAYLLLGIENQTDINLAEPVRCMLYDATEE